MPPAMVRTCVAAVAATVGAFVLAPSAGAAINCDFDGSLDILTVNLTSHEDFAQLDVRTGEIRVFDQNQNPSQIVTCASGPPTVTGTDTVFIVDGSDDPATGPAGDGSTTMQIVEPTAFAPGQDAETGHPANIEFFVNPNTGTDDLLALFGTEGADNWEIGVGGVNWNAAADVADPDDELVLSTPTLFDGLQAYSAGGGDFVSARGGLATGGPITTVPELSLSGGPDNDVVAGGDGGDVLQGDDGNDILQGFSGNDSLQGFRGNDTLGGGAGSSDVANFTANVTGVNVDLNLTGPQDTEEGTDTLTGMEGLVGSGGDDTLIGNEGPNTIEGSLGNDTIDGRGGPDALDGEDDSDTLTYEQASAGVFVNLTTNSASGGAGADTVIGLENLIGSPFADTLTGDGEANAITGLGGSDTIAALAGADSVQVRDGESDVASCGTEIDTATADEQVLDVIDADCETVSYRLPEDNELILDVTRKRAQRIVKQTGVVVTATCPLEACTATATARGKLPKPERGRAPLAKLQLKPITKSLTAGTAERIKLPLKRKQLDAVGAALRNGARPRVKVTVNATDAAGNTATQTAVVKLRR